MFRFQFRLTSPTAIALGVAAVLLGAPAAHAAEERFGLLPGSVMQNDDSGVEGTTGYARGFGYEVVQGYAVAEGDMVLGRIDARGRLEVPFRPRGLAQRSAFDRWPDGVVPYAFHPGLSELQQRNVEEAIERLNEKTRIALVPAGDPAAEGYVDYVLFEPSTGCASYVGRQLTEDAQSLWVADSCSVGSIVHEIAHAIGLFHEHTRPDRDSYVDIVWDEIIDDKEFNFEIYDAGAESFGGYDYDSIMHYGEYFFTKRGERTIVVPTGVDIGQRDGLSVADIETIDRMYATDLALDTTVLETERGLEIDLSITNNGDLGARAPILRVRGDLGTDWLSVSADSGWDCLAYDEELRCERDRLIERESLRFTVVADPATTSVDGLSFRLDAETLDPDPSNNGGGAAFGDEESDEPLPPPAPAAALPEPASSETEASAAPAAASPTTRSSTGVAADGEAGGAGAMGGGGALALIGLLASRARRRRT